MIVLKIIIFPVLFLLIVFLLMIIIPVKIRFQASYLHRDIAANVTLYWFRPFFAVQLRYLDLKSLVVRVEILYIPISKRFHFVKREENISDGIEKKPEPDSKLSQEHSKEQKAAAPGNDGLEMHPKPDHSQKNEPTINLDSGAKMSQAEWDELADTVSGGELDFTRDENGKFQAVESILPSKEKNSWREQFKETQKEYGPAV
ncbi:MAG TPA: hypothetical protein ENN84_11180, partial [Candidatus Marinimicrobia bacterium]|nr:hypothetical protein [Candidatus Neomarinimicrobiota bacterium]